MVAQVPQVLALPVQPQFFRLSVQVTAVMLVAVPGQLPPLPILVQAVKVGRPPAATRLTQEGNQGHRL
jgi:hypothetical protein